MVSLNRKSTVPLYVQLKVELIKLIVSGKFKSLSRFYSLSEIVKKYNVSMITACRVLDELTTEGYLKKSQGKRSIVTGARARNGSSKLVKIAVFFYSKSDTVLIEYNQMPWASMIFAGIQETLLEKKALWTMISASNSKDAAIRLEEIKDEHDAFICLSPSIEDELTVAFEKLRCPYVIIQPSREKLSYNFVAADYYSGSSELAKMGIKKNYKSFLYLFNDRNGNPEKMRGFLETLISEGVSPQQIHLRITGSFDEKNIKEVFAGFTKEQDRDKLLPLAVYSFT